MAKRNKRLEKGAESLRNEIEMHFLKLKKDFETGNLESGRYHLKELDKSLIFAFEKKLEILGMENDLVIGFKERLEKLKRKFEC